MAFGNPLDPACSTDDPLPVLFADRILFVWMVTSLEERLR
jgi:hypothetical protein